MMKIMLENDADRRCEVAHNFVRMRRLCLILDTIIDVVRKVSKNRIYNNK